MSIPPIRSIGPYRLENLLGRGGMGEVWAAHDERLDRRVAIKHVRAEAAADEKNRQRFQREAWAAARIAHPSVVPVFDVLEHIEGDWIVMEYVDGPTLRALVEDEPLGFPDVLRYGRQLAAGLAAAHAQGLVHRDLKAENVMIAPSGHAKILDFGLAKKIATDGDDSALTLGGEVMGTVRAMSPEQARGLDVDARSDLFSLGTLLYEITTGISPFIGQTALDTMSRVATYQPEPISQLRPDLPTSLSRLVEALLEKAPERRPQSAVEVAGILKKIAAELTAAQFRIRTNDPSGSITSHSEAPIGDSPSVATSPSIAAPTRPANRLGLSRQHPAPLLIALSALALTLAVIVFAHALRPGTRASGHQTPVRNLPAPMGQSTDEASPQRASRDILNEARRQLAEYDDPEKLERATNSLQRLVASQPQSASAHAALADAYARKFMMENDRSWLERSLGVARQAVALDAHLATAHIALGAALRLSGEAEPAQAALKKALELEPGNPRALLENADLELSAGRLEPAEQILQGVIKAGRATAEHYDLLGIIQVYAGDYERAEKALRESVTLAPNRTIGYRNLAGVLHFQGRLEEAAQQIREALEIRPSHSLYSNLGTLLFTQGLYPQAAEAFDKALAANGSHFPIIWMNLGDAYRFIPGQEQEAATAYQRAAQLFEKELISGDPSSESRSRLALVLAKRGSVQRAKAELEKLTPERSGQELSASSLYRVAVTSELLNERSQALAFLDRCLDAGFSAHEIANDPELSELRRDPAYQRLLSGRGEASD